MLICVAAGHGRSILGRSTSTRQPARSRCCCGQSPTDLETSTILVWHACPCRYLSRAIARWQSHSRGPLPLLHLSHRIRTEIRSQTAEVSCRFIINSRFGTLKVLRNGKRNNGEKRNASMFWVVVGAKVLNILRMEEDRLLRRALEEEWSRQTDGSRGLL